jgi:hypothetical protein
MGEQGGEKGSGLIGAAIRRRFLGIDEGRARLSLYDTAEGGPSSAPLWTRELADYPLCRDLQRLGPDLALVGFDRGFFELEISSGRITRLSAPWKNVTAARRLDDGTTLVTGLDLDGGSGVTVLSLDPELRVAHVARREGDYVRLMRPAGTGASGSYLLCTNDHILETTTELAPIRKLAAPGFLHAWKAERLADGSTLVSAGYGAFMAHFDAAGALAQTFGGKGDVPPEIEPNFYATFQVLDDGRLLVANWEGHGPGNGRKGRQLLEFSPAGEFIGSWSDPERISSLQGILVL